MADQIYIGNFAKGLTSNRLPFNIDNDAFPTLYNFYAWRGRVKRKRGTVYLGQLEVQLQLSSSPNNWEKPQIFLSGGAVNLISSLSLVSTSTITPGSINLTTTDDGQLYTDLLENGTLQGNASGSGTINYSTGEMTIVAGGTSPVIGTFSYYPSLPVMGLEDFVPANSNENFPLLLSFDTDYSYQLNQTTVTFYNVNYYKTTNNPFLWTGQDYQQFWTTNYQNAFWATNNKPGFNFIAIQSIVWNSSTQLQIVVTGTAGKPPVIVGDMVWTNEITTNSSVNVTSKLSSVNGQTGTVGSVTESPPGTFTLVVNFPNSSIINPSAGDAGKIYQGGIIQLLTNSIAGQDGIKWYDGDPTNGTGLPTNTGLGWVNFAPPLTAISVSLNDKDFGLFYLVGALAIVPFKDRLLFFSPWIQTSGGTIINLQDTCIWSWNGTPYYNSVVPIQQTYNTAAYYVDQTGYGGYLSAGISQPIATVSTNEDVLLVGFGGRGRKTRFTYSGNDLQPFLFFNINSELPSSATFSSIALDRGAIDLGIYGIALTDQQSSQRIDLEIPDNIFQLNYMNNGLQRINAIRDFQKEWIYFSYVSNDSANKFPNQTFLYNYRDNTWGILYENYTCHGNYRKQQKYTWATLPFKTWAQWREPWNSGTTSALVPQIVAGTPQGYVIIKGEGTGEASSGTIYALSSSGGNTQITSYNHCVNVNDYIQINSCLGTTSINTLIGKVIKWIDSNNFVIDLVFPSGTYMGLGTFTRLCQPFLQTKQFGVYWEDGKQTRLSAQKYLMDYTANAQVTVNFYLSQDPDDIWNDPQDNSAVVYSQIMYTCPESTNIGLTPANTNLQMPTAEGQYQIWHRYNTSLIGDSVQIGITLSDAQMRNLTFATSEITLHGMHLVVEKGPLLS